MYKDNSPALGRMPLHSRDIMRQALVAGPNQCESLLVGGF